MTKNVFVWFSLSASLASAVVLTAACSPQSDTLLSPSGASSGGIGAGPGGSTLKVAAPAPQSPANGVKLPDSTQNITLVVSNSTPMYGTNPTLGYRFEVYNSAGTRVYTNSSLAPAGQGTTSFIVPVGLDANQTYGWQARAEYQNTYVSTWSTRFSFTTPDVPRAYMNGAELYDPLIDGTTIGQIHGPVQFIPGQGVKLLGWDSYISYQLPATLTEGEYSLIVTNMPQKTTGDKQKVMGMAEGYSDIIENARRMTVEKRGDGAVAWRFLTPSDRIETEGDGERVVYPFSGNMDYFYQSTWRGNIFGVLIQEGGVGGRTVYNKAKSWKGAGYAPTPHVIYIGAPVGRSGSSAASIENTIYRQIWVSARPRPAFAK